MAIQLPKSDKINNNGSTAQGKLRAEEWNTLVKAVSLLVDSNNESVTKLKNLIISTTAYGQKIDEIAYNDMIQKSQIEDLQEAFQNLPSGGEGGGGSNIVVDSKLNPNSKNPVQNRVIVEALSSAIDGKERKIYTLQEYMELRNSGQLVNQFYTVYKDGELYRLYLGYTLVMKKKESEDEKVTMGCVFPLVIPIIFA